MNSTTYVGMYVCRAWCPFFSSANCPIFFSNMTGKVLLAETDKSCFKVGDACMHACMNACLLDLGLAGDDWSNSELLTNLSIENRKNIVDY